MALQKHASSLVEPLSCSKHIASFPGHSHCQHLIACSMKNGRGRTGRSGHVHAVPSGTQMVDTWGWCTQMPDGRAFVRQMMINNIRCSKCWGYVDRRKTGIITVGHRPCVSMATRSNAHVSMATCFNAVTNLFPWQHESMVLACVLLGRDTATVLPKVNCP